MWSISLRLFFKSLIFDNSSDFLLWLINYLITIINGVLLGSLHLFVSFEQSYGSIT